MLEQSKSENTYFRISIGLFLILFGYIFLRAWLVEPLNDEILSFFFYIETGRITGESALLDANNHLINSIVGHFLFRLFGEHFFLFRLLSVAGFALYFWGIYKLLTLFGKFTMGSFWILTITCIPYMLEYFAYARGYGFSIGCFIWAVYFAAKLQENFSIRHVLWAFLFTWLTVASNFSMMISAFLLVTWIIILQLKNGRNLSFKKHLLFLIVEILFVAGLFPLILKIFELKEKGLLYYGSLDGFWEVTGRSLSTVIFFTDHESIKYLLIGIGFFMVVYFISTWIRKGKNFLIAHPSVVLAYFLFGNILAIFSMAFLLKVNYPPERTAMYFIPLLFLTIAFIINETKIKQLLLLYLFFPLTFFLNVSFQTSIFSPEDRMNTHFYSTVREQLNTETTICGHHVMELSWPMHERSTQHPIVLLPTNAGLSIWHDLVLSAMLTEVPKEFSQLYDTLTLNKESSHIAFKRKKALRRLNKKVVQLDKFETSEEFQKLYFTQLSDSLDGKTFLYQLEGELGFPQGMDDLLFVVSTLNEKGEGVRFESYNLRWYGKMNSKAIKVNLAHVFIEKKPEEKEIRFYLWNLKKKELKSIGLRLKQQELLQ